MPRSFRIGVALLTVAGMVAWLADAGRTRATSPPPVVTTPPDTPAEVALDDARRDTVGPVPAQRRDHGALQIVALGRAFGRQVDDERGDVQQVEALDVQRALARRVGGRPKHQVDLCAHAIQRNANRSLRIPPTPACIDQVEPSTQRKLLRLLTCERGGHQIALAQATQFTRVQLDLGLDRQAQFDLEGVQRTLICEACTLLTVFGAQHVLTRLVHLELGNARGRLGTLLLHEFLQRLVVGLLVFPDGCKEQRPVVPRGDVHREHALKACVVTQFVQEIALRLTQRLEGNESPRITA